MSSKSITVRYDEHEVVGVVSFDPKVAAEPRESRERLIALGLDDLRDHLLRYLVQRGAPS